MIGYRKSKGRAPNLLFVNFHAFSNKDLPARSRVIYSSITGRSKENTLDSRINNQCPGSKRPIFPRTRYPRIRLHSQHYLANLTFEIQIYPDIYDENGSHVCPRMIFRSAAGLGQVNGNNWRHNVQVHPSLAAQPPPNVT
jgi:hypothetical protein